MRFFKELHIMSISHFFFWKGTDCCLIVMNIKLYNIQIHFLVTVSLELWVSNFIKMPITKSMPNQTKPPTSPILIVNFIYNLSGNTVLLFMKNKLLPC